MNGYHVNAPAQEPEANKVSLIHQITDAIEKVQKRFQAEGEDEESSWMIRQTDNPAAISFLRRATVMMLHIIDAIEELEPVNGIRISQKLGIPRGSVSKITRKLVQENVIQMEYLPDNKKMILFRTTPFGREISRIHQSLHRQIGINVHNFLNKYDAEQLSFLVHVLQDTLETSWVEDNASGVSEPKGISAASGQKSGAVLSDDPLPDIMDMLKRLDAESLLKVKKLMKVLFFDADVRP
ncbi:winged helix DNA-binding protein [Paenibacillus sp. M1]|uniref:Winged helix DNA-binding protein n=1 Tax=Paenibacillus haidiansis TaxID=1574488 RepID=A0ABU7VWX1_9BACL